MAPSDRASSVLWASAAHWLVRSRLKRWRFARLLAHERHRAPRRSHNASAQTLANLHAAFQHASLWMGEADQCLARSIAFRMLAFRLGFRSEEHTSELQSLMRISYAVFCLKKKKLTKHNQQYTSLHLTYSISTNNTLCEQ